MADPRTRGLVIQGALLAAILALGAWFYSNLLDNMAARGLTFGFGYLERPSNFAIGESLIPYAPTDTYGRAIMVGLLNTIRVAVIGIVLCTLLGVTLGVMRLSTNPLLSRLVGAYIEIVRNTPLLLQLFFWYAVINSLPRPREALSPVPGIFLSNRGFKVPWIEWTPDLWPALWAFAAGVAGTIAAARILARHQERTGERKALWPIALGLLVGLPALAAAAMGWPVTVSVPQLAGFNFRGGAMLTPDFAALLVGLTLYTAAFVAEIVRGGIQSVGNGQWEAARALGLPAGRIMRLVILPQALRVIIPPLTSQFLNLTKNSSLAVAIGYPDLVHVSNTTMNQTGQAVEAVLIFMSIYLALSLATSAFMNWYNARVAIRER
jgi:general L-amino acid transport system permease protein